MRKGQVVENQKGHHLQRWKFGELANATKPGTVVVVIKQFCRFPRLRLLHLLFVGSPAWIATTKANRKPFSWVQTIPQTPSTGGKNHPVRSCNVTEILTQRRSRRRCVVLCNHRGIHCVTGRQTGGTSVSNADLGVTERGIACQETPTLQPPPFHSPILPPTSLPSCCSETRV